jgi:hypothetical protein
MSNDTVMVNNQRMSPEEFRKYQEELEKNKSKRLKEVVPGNYRVLTRLQG